MTKIRDENFLTPSEINEHPCFTADRWLNRVLEEVTIQQCCQDSTDTSLVIIDFTLVGVFEFTPYVKILSVDGDTSYGTLGVAAPLAIGHYKNPVIPIVTNCQTFHGQIVFDFGSVIPNFISAQQITFELGMIGHLPSAYGVSFPDQTPTTTFIWTKGRLPQPVDLLYQNGNLTVVFEYNGDVNCSCGIQCVRPSGVSQNITFCPDEKQSIVIYQGELSTDPYSVLLEMQDGLGNISKLDFQSLVGVRPQNPVTAVKTNPRRVEVGLTNASVNGVALTDAEYQILRFHGSVNNYRIWKDWSHRDWNYFVDYDVIPGEKYGYAVRYKGKFNEISKLSSWAEVTI